MFPIYFRMKFILTIVFFSSIYDVFAQVKVPFLPRSPIQSPAIKNYKLKGDFFIIGNTNLTLENYDDNLMNDNKLVFVDVDDDPETFNSSSATLDFSIQDPKYFGCNSIVFAGLYWVGRGDPQTSFNVTNDGITKSFDKREIKIKADTESEYTTLRAKDTDIRFPIGLNDQNDLGIFVGFVDVTELIKKSHDGTFTVADIALIEGTNYHIGGWSIVVVYQNPLMPFRDITVFDGYAYVRGDYPEEFNIPVSGFKTIDQGDVNVKIGVMAGEGDVAASGDFFSIKKGGSVDEYINLFHSQNSPNNFFNSSINTGGNKRFPDIKNNTGLDLSVFEIPNSNNEIIQNGQNKIEFKYGTTWDALVIYNLTVAIEAQKPEVEPFQKHTSLNGLPITNTNLIEPGDELSFTVEIRNRGDLDLIENTLEIPLPNGVEFISANVNYFFDGTIHSQPELKTDQNGNSYLYWKIGDLPKTENKEEILASMTYSIKVSNDCFILINECNLEFQIDGTVSGLIKQNQKPYPSTSFVFEYKDIDDGLCSKEPVYKSIPFKIDPKNIVSENCGFQGDEIPVCFSNETNEISWEIARQYFSGTTRFFSEIPINQTVIEYGNETERDFPQIEDLYFYAIFNMANPNCYKKFKWKDYSIKASVEILKDCNFGDIKSEVIIKTNTLSPQATIFWGDDLTSGDTSRFLDPGNYKVKVISNYCENEISFEVPEKEKFEMRINKEESLLINFCNDDNSGLIVIEIDGKIPFSFLKLDGDLVNGGKDERILEDIGEGKYEFNKLESGNYKFTLVTENGCEKIIYQEIQQTQANYIDVSFDFTSISFENSGHFIANSEITFQISGNLNEVRYFEWEFGDGNSVSDKLSPVHIYNKNGEFMVILNLVDNNGCKHVISKKIILEGSFLRVPNAFNPNFDGNNKYFFPIFNQVDTIKFWIFNSWGELIYFSENLSDKGWDGTKNGKTVPLGTYVYKVIYSSQGSIPAVEIGNFLLLK